MTGGGEHVEVRVTGKPEAVDAVLRLLRAGGPGITGGGARGPYDRRDGSGQVAFYAHLQVDVDPSPPVRPRCPVVVPAHQRPRIVELSGVPASEADWRCCNAPHRGDEHTVLPREGGHLFSFSADEAPAPRVVPSPRRPVAVQMGDT